MRSIIAIFFAALFITSCASNNYMLYADTQTKIAQANAIAETARYNALLEIAKSGDSAAKVAAVISIQMGQGGGSARSQQQIIAPEDWDTKLLKWAGVIGPVAMQGLAIGAQIHNANTQRQIAVTQSNNALATAQSTNNTFTSMSSNMATSNTNIARAGFDALGAAGTNLASVATAGITGVNNAATTGLTAATTLGTAGITGVNTAATTGLTAATTLGTAGITGVNTAVANSNTTISALGSQASTNLTNVTAGYKSALDAAISKLTGTTVTTTTTTTNSIPMP